MSDMPNNELAEAVQQSLKRMGFDEYSVREICDGQVTLFCPTTDRNEQCMILAALRAQPGVNSVTFEALPKVDPSS